MSEKTSILDELITDATGNEPLVSPIADEYEDHPELMMQVDPTDTLPPPLKSNPAPAVTPQYVADPGQVVPPQTGEVFDPAIHSVDGDGKPIKTKAGTFAKKRGRKLGQTSATTNPNRVTVEQRPPNYDIARAAAIQTVNCIFIIGSVIGGEEFAPIVNKELGYDEPAVLRDAWTEYYITTNVENIPPWLGVVIATGSYFVMRCSMPKTQTKLARLWDWIMSKFGKGKEPV